MKKISTLIIALTIATIGFSQQKATKKALPKKDEATKNATVLPKITIKEMPENIAGSTQNALTVKIANSKPVDIEEAFKTHMKSYNGKRMEKGGITFIDNADIKEMSENTVDVYIKGAAAGNDVNLIVAFDLGGIFLSSKTHPPKYAVAEKIIREFAIKMTSEPLVEQLKNAQKEQAKIEGEQKILEKENIRLNEEIQSYKAKIKIAEDNLAKNKLEQDKKKTDLATQKKAVVEAETKLNAMK